MTAVERATVADPSPYARWATWSGIALYFLCLFWGAAQVAFPGNIRLYWLFAFGCATSSICWIRYDALARGKPILPVLQLIGFFLWPLAAVIYLISRSGWRGLLLAIAHGFGMYLLTCLAFYVTFYGLHFAGLLHDHYY